MTKVNFTFKEYVEAAAALLNEHPEYAEFPVIFASDDEGNTFQQVSHVCGPMRVEDPEEYYLEELDSNVPEDLNVICVN